MENDSTLNELPQGDGESLKDAITALYLEWRVSLRRFATLRNYGSKSDPEDLVQDAFVELYRQVMKGSIIEKPKAWLNQVIINRAWENNKKAQRLSSHLKSLPTPQHDQCGAVDENLERAEMLKLALSKLNERERNILMLRQSGATYQEIADTLNTNPGLVGVYIARAFEKLRNQKS